MNRTTKRLLAVGVVSVAALVALHEPLQDAQPSPWANTSFDRFCLADGGQNPVCDDWWQARPGGLDDD